ncbi:hypothetical protein Tco_0933403 [Tanacetum coccineum]
MFVIEQPLPAARAADSEIKVLAQWNVVYDAYNEVACLIIGSMTPKIHRQFQNSSPYDMIKELKFMFEKQVGVERFDLIQTFHACKQEEGKPVGPYVLKMKGYVDQLERLGCMLPQDISVGLMLNGLTSDFVGFVRNYNIHNMGKTVGELHALLIEYEKGLPKKVATLQVMAIQGGRIQKAIKKSQNAKGKGKGKGKGKDKRGRALEKELSCLPAELIMKKKQVGNTSSSGNGIYEIDMHGLVLNVSSIYIVSNKRAKHYLDSTYLWHCRLAHICKKRKITRKPFPHRTERVTGLLGIIHTHVWGCDALMKRDTPDKLQQRSVKCIFIEISGRAEELKEIQDEDTSPSKNTSEIPMKVEGLKPPQEEVVPIRSVKTYLGKCFAMKELGEAAFILGIKIYRDRSKQLIGLSQSAYMDKILKRYRMDNSKRGYIHMQEKLDLNKTQGASTPEEVKRMQNVPYASAVGSIIYIRGNLKAELRVDCYCDAGFKSDNGGTLDWK